MISSCAVLASSSTHCVHDVKICPAGNMLEPIVQGSDSYRNCFRPSIIPVNNDIIRTKGDKVPWLSTDIFKFTRWPGGKQGGDSKDDIILCILFAPECDIIGGGFSLT